ncbi:toprim domain-containing protein [Sphingobacterium bovistauri]|uniref:Toprim domain-containing protein n=1 Tax=Sphingobacterium bovistauri TaxID=2781959 RepID=A0ABS7Z7G8_9SPHI|nr:toprim domain-containing protein [Sphingobacterium bovistauri]MCA5006136.1 toprim domain-containing protein [Sphingobacterium bovistauri]
MVTWNIATQIKDQVALVDLLAKLGHNAAYSSGKELFYKSMLREERTPSFCVDEKLGVWYDHGGANTSGIKGGNIIDFGLAFWYPLRFKEVLRKIADIMAIPLDESINVPMQVKRPRTTALKVSNYEIETIKALNTHPAITRFLKSRGIWEVAQEHIKEVYYAIKAGPKAGRQFFSAGWQNDSGGWELRNQIADRDFKSCLGKKAITTIPGSADSLAIFEGFMDFLSWKVDNPEAGDTIIVLNSVVLLDAAITKAQSFSRVHAYFDRDKAGESAFQSLKSVIPHAVDQSFIYHKHKDYNEMLMARKTNLLFYEEEHIYEKMLATYRR